MKEILLLGVVILIFIFLYFVIKKWDAFLGDNFSDTEDENKEEE